MDNQELPKLSASEFRTYNRMADMMQQFHNHFRLTWNEIYSSVNTSFVSSQVALDQTETVEAQPSKPKSKGQGKCNYPPPASKPLTTPRLLRTIQQFIRHLTAHHDIEEQHIFPHLATKMPVFQSSDLLKSQHAEIHDGLDKLEAYAREVQSGKRDLRREELKGILDSFGEVLWEHLDQEVIELGAERMRKHWTLKEMERMPF